MKKFYSKFFALLSVFFLLKGFSYAQLTLVEWNFPNNPDDAIADIAIPANAAQTIYTVGGTATVGYGTNTGATTRSAWCTAWHSGSGVKYWEMQVNTTGYFNLEFSSKQRSSSTGPRDFRVEYKIGAAGAWTAVTGATIVCADNFTTGVLNNIPLPIACENQPSVYLRWIMTTNTAVNLSPVASGGSSRVDDVNISANSGDHYRTIASGNWNNIAIWESSPNLIAWSPAVIAPSRYSQTITVRNAHTVNITANATMDELTVENGATLNYSTGIQTIYDATGVDMQVDGIFIDGSVNNTIWNGTPRWQLGVNGTYIKTQATNATNWQNNYNGGISTIPATANWIIRKNSAAAPALTTIGMFYPNLTIENIAGGVWATAVGSTFTGAGGTATIKGSFDIGGASALGTVDFLNDNTNATPVQVLGNMTIRAGNNLRNNGTGFELYGTLTVDGSSSYSGAAARKFKFSGGAAQSISGTGTLASFGVYQLQMTKSGNELTLNRPVKVNGNLDLQNGIINSSNPNFMVVEDNGTVTNTSNSSFVRGPVRKLGDEAFTFPVGKNNDYQSIGSSAGPPPTGGPFWTESFQNGCGSDCFATSYSGPNGAWTTTNTGPNGSDPNIWYVSGAECGNTPPACGTSCGGTDPSLHIGSNPSVLGDIGAAYLAGGLGFWFPQTNVRAESPFINCTGYSNITLTFNYIEWGSGTVDDASLWYYDGSTWSLYFNLAKTACCGGPCNGSRQGMWTTYSTVLPASANNNPNIKIGFNWTNNDDNVGEDPSIAVDDIVLSVSSSVEQFTAEYFYNDPQVPYGNVLNPNLAQISNCEYWILTRDIGTSNRFVTLSFDANSCGFQNNPANLLVANHVSGQWYDRGNGGFTATTVTTFGVQTDYGPFTLGSVVPLPIELLSFTASYNGSTVDLKWATASEINNDHYDIERSVDGNNFEKIIYVKGAGNSTSLINYAVTDKNPLNGLSYYRLRQTDFDGAFSLSKNVAVRIAGDQLSLAYVYGNASLSQVCFQLLNPDNSKLKVEVVDALGRLIVSKNIEVLTEDEIKLNTPSLRNGWYTFRLSSDSFVANVKFFY